MNDAPTAADLLMSETMQLVGMMVKSWPFNAQDKEDLRHATLTALLEVVRGLDAGDIRCSLPEYRGALMGLLGCVFELLLVLD